MTKLVNYNNYYSNFRLNPPLSQMLEMKKDVREVLYCRIYYMKLFKNVLTLNGDESHLTTIVMVSYLI